MIYSTWCPVELPWQSLNDLVSGSLHWWRYDKGEFHVVSVSLDYFTINPVFESPSEVWFLESSMKGFSQLLLLNFNILWSLSLQSDGVTNNEQWILLGRFICFNSKSLLLFRNLQFTPPIGLSVFIIITVFWSKISNLKFLFGV